MLYRILFLLYTVYAQIDPITGLINLNPERIYSRAYLRGMKQAADEKKELHLLNQVINNAEITIVNAATNGLLEYSAPFPGCVEIIKETGRNDIPIEMCKRVAHGVVAFITQRFPDSELTYDKQKKVYTLRWN